MFLWNSKGIRHRASRLQPPNSAKTAGLQRPNKLHRRDLKHIFSVSTSTRHNLSLFLSFVLRSNEIYNSMECSLLLSTAQQIQLYCFVGLNIQLRKTSLFSGYRAKFPCCIRWFWQISYRIISKTSRAGQNTAFFTAFSRQGRSRLPFCVCDSHYSFVFSSTSCIGSGVWLCFLTSQAWPLACYILPVPFA